MITDYLFLLLTFPIASVLHGADAAPKPVIWSVHAVASLAASLYAPIAVAVYWICFRRSWHADAELKYLQKKGTIFAVHRAYPLGIGKIIARAIEDLGNRREQEFVSAFILGIPLALVGLV